MNVGKMWKTPETCGKLAKKCGKHVDNCPKNVDNCPKNVGNFVEKMWECGKHVGNSFVCTNNNSPKYKCPQTLSLPLYTATHCTFFSHVPCLRARAYS